MRTVTVRKIELGSGMPKICVPLIGKTKEELLTESFHAGKSQADLVEWRIDWYEDVFDMEKLCSLSKDIRKNIDGRPLLITFRTKEEGGEREISLAEYQSLLTEICEAKMGDMVDIEAMKDREAVSELIRKAKDAGIVTVGSNHDFHKTPGKEELIRRLVMMQELGFDITKIAVMPQNERDVLTLLDATLAMKETYADRPFITMSMTKKGLVSRLAGETFGSCLTFGTVGAASAPGQIGAEELKTVLHLFHK